MNKILFTHKFYEGTDQSLDTFWQTEKTNIRCLSAANRGSNYKLDAHATKNYNKKRSYKLL